MTKRTNNLVTRLSDDEMMMIKAVSEALDEPMTRLIRRLIRERYVERFGVTPPPTKSK